MQEHGNIYRIATTVTPVASLCISFDQWQALKRSMYPKISFFFQLIAQSMAMNTNLSLW